MGFLNWILLGSLLLTGNNSTAMINTPNIDLGFNRDSILKFSTLRENFINPHREYRTAPLWDWNDSITKEGIDFQMSEFKNAGIGGVFVHPRPGLITEYLSKSWFELFGYTVKKGKELGMNVWIYDENSYPSGFAGGHVSNQMPSSYNEGTGLVMQKYARLNILPSDTVEVVLEKAEKGYIDISSIYEDMLGKSGVFYVFKKTYPEKSPWFGGASYVDLLHKGVTKKFLDITMEKGYKLKSGVDFGETVKGVFSDEPNTEEALSNNSDLRWTPDLCKVFKEKWGYDLKIHLPMLIEETGNWKKIRHDYYSTLLDLFIDRWVKPVSQYHRDNNLIWTGHYWEHGWPVPTTGFDESAVYAEMGMPGIDMLGNELEESGQGPQFGNTRAVRELRSVANQMGKRRTLSETYGGGGWDVDFKTFKRLVDWEVVLGVNFVNQHLSYYTLKGVRKFDYPPSFSYHEPWWDDYRFLVDYTSRISLAMSSGEQVNSTLVLQPTTSAWMYFSRRVKNSRLDSIQYNFKDFVYKLERRHLEYDLGSEKIMATYGKVNKNKLVIGKRSYDLVVIPKSMENMEESTVNLLQTYLASGGKVLSYRKSLERVDGEESPLIYKLQKQYPNQWFMANSLRDSISSEVLFPKDQKIIEEKKINNGDLYFQRRILQDGQLLFFVNSNENHTSEASILLEGRDVVKMDLENGDINRVPFTHKGKKVSFDVDIQPIGSVLYFVSTNPISEEYKLEKSRTWELVIPVSDISVEADSDNILVIDYLDLKTSDTLIENTHFMNVLNLLYEEKGVKIGNPWQHKIQYKSNYVKLDTFSIGTGFIADYRFRVNKESDLTKLTDTKLAIERPELWDVYINGHKVIVESDEFWIDKDFPLLRIGDYLKFGENIVSLKLDRMSIFAEIMPVYILGNFKLKNGKGNILEIEDGILDSIGWWKENGYGFYSNKVSYTQVFNVNDEDCEFKIRLNDWNGTVSEIIVNGEKAGIIGWPPFELNVSDFIRAGKNEIVVRVVGSLRNTFGPFYGKDNKSLYGPFEWKSSPDAPSLDSYNVINYGLLQPFDMLKSI